MTYEQVISHFGTQEKVATAIGIAQPSFSAGVKRWGGVPPAWQYQLEIITGGALKADEPLRRPRAAA